MVVRDPWRGLITNPLTGDHFVQVYRDDRVLIEAISLFAGAALGRSEGVLLVPTRAHGEAVESRLAADGFDVAALKAWGQLTVLDARETLSRLMVNGVPDPARFRALAGGIVASVRLRFREVRVYGEMVDLLWIENLPAATRLEELWNDLIQRESISLFCAYGLHANGRSVPSFPGHLQALHTHFIPAECAS
jgi:hypothetical protein